MIFSSWFEKRKKELQRQSKIKTAKKVIFSTAVGSLGGLVGGLLFSPKSGKENRKDIVDSSKDITNNIKEKTVELKENINNTVNNAKDNLTDAKVKISEYLNEKKPLKVFKSLENSETDVIIETKDISTDEESVEKKSKK
ncbi:YtxH domain-containing protein [Clostridium lacusfryxellense]|uniref:YtxH domain-containing protein n=1 Tax=Clostridium lacusfryxellense TaxID=205328 RepID=UPI001C0D6F51|nr:YtxH domain-containing protein [Clostridium lacusfryxellense]MBU3111879.1 YtxH domain-containing protein [Clostridium lacusfryxellense]